MRIVMLRRNTTMKSIAIGLVLLAATAVEAQQMNERASGVRANATLVTCESKNNVRHTCDVDVRGRMVNVNQQLSDNACVLGRTWGVNRDRKSIWVDSGCRAEFVVGAPGMARAAFARSLMCQSKNNGKATCPADTSYGVQLARQLSKNDCERGKDWGFDQNGVWVDNGCRAEFVLGGERRFAPMTSSASPVIVTCESANNATTQCRADTYYGVTLARQLSKSACMRGETWGYDANGIWVSGGCRADFVLGQ
jgi:hypothetical protein